MFCAAELYQDEFLVVADATRRNLYQVRLSVCLSVCLFHCLLSHRSKLSNVWSSTLLSVVLLTTPLILSMGSTEALCFRVVRPVVRVCASASELSHSPDRRTHLVIISVLCAYMTYSAIQLFSCKRVFKIIALSAVKR